MERTIGTFFHYISLNYYDPEDENFVFVNTVSGNKDSYRKQRIKAVEHSRELYESLGYPSVKYYKWVIQRNL